MMPGKFRFSRRSEKNLEGVKPQLVAVVRRALELTEVDFGITEGLRSKYRQKQLVAEGKSQTMNSRHRLWFDGTAGTIRMTDEHSGGGSRYGSLRALVIREA